jgi:transcription-repair coupling factor (superfamily II helicase)
VLGLIEVGLVRGMAARFGITEISQREEQILLFPEKLDVKAAASAALKLKGRVMVNAGAKPYIAIKPQKGEEPTKAIRDTLEAMRD